MYLVFGVVFGVVLSRSGATDYDVIQQMFLLESIHMYALMGAAVLVAAPSIRYLKRRGKTLTGQTLEVQPRPAHRGNLIGGMLFGAGWAVTGMCPGPIFVNIGEGKVYAIAALVGALVGAGAFGGLYGRLQPFLRLPLLGSEREVN